MKITRYFVIVLIVIPMIVAAKTREEIPEKYKWDLSHIYETPEQFAAAKKNAEQKLTEVEGCKAHLGESATRLKQCLDLVFSIYQEYVRLNAYAMQRYDENLKNLEAQKAKGEVDQLGVIIREKAAWLSPEIQAIGSEKIEAFLKQKEGLSQYRVYLKDTLRAAQHTLSASEEALLSRAGMVTGTPYNTYGAFTSSDMVYPKVKLSDGTEIDLGQAAYTKYRSSENRQDRKIVFEEFFKAYKKNENTLGVLLNSQNQGDWFVAKSRKYGSSVEAASVWS